MTASEESVLACINIIIGMLGCPSKDIAPTPDDTFDNIVDTLQQQTGTRIRQRHVPPRKLDKLTLPVVLLSPSGEAFVLAQRQGEQALILDPAVGKPQVIAQDELLARWDGRLLEVGKRQSRFDIRWFIPAFLQQKRLLGEILLFSLVLQILALISPLFFQVVMDKVLVHQAWATLDVLVFGLLITALVEVCLRGLREYQYAHTANRIDIQLGLRMVQHLFALPLLYFKDRKSVV